ncbi:MAG: oxidoreductase [Chitinivibrionales bacterium]|nr:oxidoreductase [Chitinivibrionales bacterium]
MAKHFALTGAAGYIAPRHLKAIKETGNELIAACDPNDSVGILDRYFFDVSFFKEFERFDRHLEKLRRRHEAIDYLTICSPNYLHDAHIRLALRLGADAVCEKPLVINPWNIDALEELSEEFGKKIHCILQLRTHPSIIALKQKIEKESNGDKHDIDLTYITSRGKWYLVSWKGNVTQSGGLATNIGVHFFDMLIWIFGEVEGYEVHAADEKTISGYLELQRARVKWYLSIDKTNMPDSIKGNGQSTFRSVTVDGSEIEFSGGFTDLHTRVYERILDNRGFGPEDCRASIQLVHDIRHAEPKGVKEHSHRLLRA